jgi:histidinol-phosphatase (PHP family)
MEASCRRAVRLGLPAIAFTEHADFVDGVHASLRPLDVGAYLAEVERCRERFPGLRILSGVELGEPHLYPSRAADVRAAGRLDRILGSVHCLRWEGHLIDASQLDRVPPERLAEAARAYLGEALALARGDQPFDTLAHIDYLKRYWPRGARAYREEDYEEELRAILRELAARGSGLEVNTTRGVAPERGLCPGPAILRWWVEEGGRAVSFGSDAHDPASVALGFEAAAAMVEAAGFRPNDDLASWWLR